MATEQEYQNLLDRIAALREQMADRLSTDLISNPQLAELQELGKGRALATAANRVVEQLIERVRVQ